MVVFLFYFIYFSVLNLKWCNVGLVDMPILDWQCINNWGIVLNIAKVYVILHCIVSINMQLMSNITRHMDWEMGHIAVCKESVPKLEGPNWSKQRFKNICSANQWYKSMQLKLAKVVINVSYYLQYHHPRTTLHTYYGIAIGREQRHINLQGHWY